jgi:hypothetical protein
MVPVAAKLPLLADAMCQLRGRRPNLRLAVVHASIKGIEGQCDEPAARG